MIFDTRQLLFTNTALRKAFAWYQIAPNQPELPIGAIAAVTPRPGGQVLVQVQQSGASRMREVMFPASKVLAVLLYFCRKQRVPIPRDAGKELEVVEDGLLLTILHQINVSAP